MSEVVYEGGFAEEFPEYAEWRDEADVARCGMRWKTERKEAAKELAL